MQQRIHLLTLGVSDLEKSMKFYRDGLRWQTKDIVGTEFENGAVVMFELAGDRMLCLYERKNLAWVHLCALSAIKNDKEIKAYFERKVNEAKNKMSVLNAVRNKLIHRVFAVIRDDRFYQRDYARNCA